MPAESQISNDARYVPCPECQAINMAHRLACYQCNQPLNLSTSGLAASHIAETRYPGKLPVKNRRRIPRKKVTIMDVSIDDQVTSTHRGTILDITPLGVCIQTDFESRVGTWLNLSVPLEGRIHRLYGVVRYREEIEKNGVAIYTYGIKLDPPERETFGAIERLEPDHRQSLISTPNDSISAIEDVLLNLPTTECE